MTHPFRWLGALMACSLLAVAAPSQTGITGKPSLKALILVVDGKGKIVWASTDPVLRNVGLLEEGGKPFKALKKAVKKVLVRKK